MEPQNINVSEGKKLIFAGLDNAGKSSIILTLLREISKITVIKATKGAQRRVYEFLGTKISEWDLGGHEKYRNKYLEQPDLFFRTDLAIYVIDVQDTQRLPKAIKYLSDIIEQFLLLQIEPPIYILFHKYDPDFTKNVHNELENKVDNLIDKIKELANYGKFYFYKTSIFDLKSIINTMSEILLITFPKSKEISDLVVDFAKKLDVEGIELIDDNSLLISSFYSDNTTKNIISLTSPYFLAINDKFTEAKSEPCQLEDQILVRRFGKFFIFKKFVLKKGGTPYYLICCKNESDFNTDIYNKFVLNLKDIIYK